MDNPLVSVVINTLNEEKNIDYCLKSLRAQSYKNIEIIVVDNFSQDRTKEIALKYTPNVFEKGPERSVQKNFGVAKSQGSYFIHLDADMALSEKVVWESLEKIKEDENIIALYIPEIVMGEKFFSKVRRFERGFYDGTAIDGIRFIKKDKFLEVGGFDDRLYACEDWDLTKKMKRIGTVSIIKSVLYHNEAEFDLKKYLKKKGYYSKNMDIYIGKWGRKDFDIKKQFGLWYRFFGVFFENGKWRKIVTHPCLTMGMYFLRVMVGLKFLTK